MKSIKENSEFGKAQICVGCTDLFLFKQLPPLPTLLLADTSEVSRSQIHERTISLMFMGMILRVLRLEVSVYNIYITNKFHTTFARAGRGGGVKSVH
jgi:hypothetical protein